MIIYIAGSISNTKDYKNIFNKAETELKLKGYEVINPTKLNHQDLESWEKCMRLCLITLLEKAEAVALLDNYEKSKGAKIEKALAEALNIPVKAIRKWL